jgi:hypothetical protein
MPMLATTTLESAAVDLQALVDVTAGLLEFADPEYSLPTPDETETETDMVGDMVYEALDGPDLDARELAGIVVDAENLVDPSSAGEDCSDDATPEERAVSRYAFFAGLHYRLCDFLHRHPDLSVPAGYETWVHAAPIEEAIAMLGQSHRAGGKTAHAGAIKRLRKLGVAVVELPGPVNLKVTPCEWGKSIVHFECGERSFTDRIDGLSNFQRNKTVTTALTRLGVTGDMAPVVAEFAEKIERGAVTAIDRPQNDASGADGNAEAGRADEPEADSREAILAELNAAMIGKFGGAVHVKSVEKVGTEKGEFTLILREGGRIHLGPVSRLTLAAVADAVADQTQPAITITPNKKRWPRVRHCILTLAEVKDVGAFSESVAAWVREFARDTCAALPRNSEAEPWSPAWIDIVLARFKKALIGKDGALLIAAANFMGWVRMADRAGLETKLPTIQNALVALGFESTRLRATGSTRRFEFRVWRHPNAEEWVSNQTGLKVGEV